MSPTTQAPGKEMMNDTLPVTLIIPTRNCRAELERHLAGMVAALPFFRQIVIVDSQSTDGTLELLEQHFSKDPRATLLSLPPGLYQSWNQAIAHADQEWVYFSTVGDILSAERFPRFFHAAQSLGCDVLLSPPAMMEADGTTPSETMWPVHRLLKRSSFPQPRMLSREETILGLFSFITGSLMGSSASNLYRREFMQAHPFPEDFGHAGDTAWGLRYGLEIRMGLFPESVATFTLGWQFQERDARQQRDSFLRLSEEGKKSFAKAGELEQELQFLAGWFEGLTASKELLWNWLADQAELAADHHALVEDMQKMEEELARRWPERIYRAVARRFSSCVF